MTIREIFDYISETHPHRFSDTTMLIWANQIDKKVFDYVSDFKANDGETFPTSFNKHSSPSEDVVIDNIELYSTYIIAKIDFSNTEYSHYNNDVAVFNQEWDDFASDFTRTHKHKESGYVGY